MKRGLAAHGLTAQRLREVIEYDQTTGVFRWRVYKRCVRAGVDAGYVAPNGRRQISVDGHLYPAARLAWLYVVGDWPERLVDHIDTDPGNDRWLNLRDVPEVTNQQNRHRAQANSKTQILGVCFDRRRGRYFAQIMPPGAAKNKYLGSFETSWEAQAAYVKAKRALHDGCTL